ncbi:hypothetical protein RRG08_012702 [Elysia crispata]|uniref:Uncharacterized protein n=1 Tax=Elysia crispata TaxID=231223 RepID=A0AAE1AE66_9GAST|nr:hypothetical protein RRG08_012702 [Elysia crispata]
MTTLPRITPGATPRSVSAAAACGGGPGSDTPRPSGRGSHCGAATSYGPYPPPELTSTWNHMKFPGRVNPLAPPPPMRRINNSWETTPQHWHNEKRRLMMQQREHERYHSAWAKPFYGPPADKEAYRRHYREVLKQQMSDRDTQLRSDFQTKVKESEAAVEYDRQCKLKDFQDFVKKFNYLKNFRDDNKMFMEKAWARDRHSKIMTDSYDREVMRYNPINWSGTLS